MFDKYRIKFEEDGTIKIKNHIFGVDILDMKPISRKKFKIYISGCISKDIKRNLDWQIKFVGYEMFLRRFFPNAIFFNPGNEIPGAKLKPGYKVPSLEKWQYNTVMRRDLENLMKCDAIAFIPDWKESQGAICEKGVAKCLGISSIYLPKIPILNSWLRKK